MNQPKSKEGKIFSALTIVAALGYFVDIYDLVLFSVEWRDSLRDLMGHHVAMDIIEKKRKIFIEYSNGGYAYWRYYLGNYWR